MAFAVDPAGGLLGTKPTPAEINAKFPGVIWQNLAASPERFSRLTDHEVFKLAQAYTYANHGDPYELVGVIRDPVQRARYLKVAADMVGAPLVAPRPVRPIFGAGRHLARQKIALTPNVGMTLDEIYLVFRTGQAMSVTAALYETSYFVGLNVSIAWGVGWYTGTAVSYLLQTYAPGVDNSIGATMAFLINGANTIAPAQWNALMLAANAARYGSPGVGGSSPGPIAAPPPPVMSGPPPSRTPTITIEPPPTPYYAAPDGQVYYPGMPDNVRQALCNNVLQDDSCHP